MKVNGRLDSHCLQRRRSRSWHQRCLSLRQAFASTAATLLQLKMSSSALTPIVHQLQQSLQHVDFRSLADGFDLKSLVTGLDLKTFSWIALIVVALIFIYELWTKSYGYDASSLAVSAADYWQDNRDQFTYDPYGRGSRSLEPLTEVLDALADAVKKWETTQENDVRNRSF